MDSDNKQRVSLYLDRETVKTVDLFMKKQGYRSRNEFFETAAENLIADSMIKTSNDLLSDKLGKLSQMLPKRTRKRSRKGSSDTPFSSRC